MNSDGLYKKFTKEYDELFINCDLVLSIPYSISLFGGTASVFGGPIMNQSIPHRGYIGFKKNYKNTNIQIKSYKRMSYKTGQMEQSKNDSFYAPSEIFLEQLSTIFSDCHVDIFILTEFETRNADIISGGIILGLDILYEKIDQNMIDFLKKSDSQSFYKNEYVKTLLKRTLLLRLNYNKLTIGGSSLDALITGIMDSNLPILHIQEKNFYSVNNETVDKRVILKKIDDFGPLYITKRTEELMDAEFNRELPFDIMMFSLGDYRNIGWYQTFLNWGENSEQIKKSLFEDDVEIGNSFFIQALEKNHLLYKTIEIISSYIFHVIKIFLDTLLLKEKVGTLFFYLRRNIELINTLLGKYNLSSHEGEDDDIIRIEFFLRELYPDLQKNNYFIYTTGSSIELKYVVLFPKYLPNYSLEQIAIMLQKQFHKSVSVLYSSKNDGMAGEGLKIEQFLERNIYFKHNGDKNILLVDQNNSIILCKNQEEAFIKANKGVLLDTVNKKIFINGEGLSSKDLPSQNATIDILAILLGNMEKEVDNSLFPQSGYSKNKNEMTGKIIIPLMRLIESKLGHRLPLVCKGNLQEFYLKLNKSDIDIFLLKKR